MARARLVVFVDPRSPISTVLCAAAVRAARARGDVEVAAIIDAARAPAPRAAGTREFAAVLAKRLFDPAHPLVVHRATVEGSRLLARRLRIPVLVPPGRDVNDPRFVSSLRERRADLALAVGCAQIFRRELLAAFPGAVNYHDALLPAYRGLHATAWSVYRGEPTTGLTFHRMTEQIDAGAILSQDAIPVRPGASVRQLEWEKTQRAAALVPDVLQALVAGDPGRPQLGEPSYFGWAELRAVTRVKEPHAVSLDELQRRLAAFGALHMPLDGRRCRVTRLRRVDSRGPRRPHLSFATADGTAVEADRLGFLPPGLQGITATLR